MSEQVNAEDVEAQKRYGGSGGWDQATDEADALLRRAFIEGAQWFAAHQPARVVPSAEEDPEPEFVQYAPEEAVGNDDDLVQWAFDKGVTWGEWHERHLTRLHDAARIARGETKGGE